MIRSKHRVLEPTGDWAASREQVVRRVEAQGRGEGVGGSRPAADRNPLGG